MIKVLQLKILFQYHDRILDVHKTSSLMKNGKWYNGNNFIESNGCLQIYQEVRKNIVPPSSPPIRRPRRTSQPFTYVELLINTLLFKRNII